MTSHHCPPQQRTGRASSSSCLLTQAFGVATCRCVAPDMPETAGGELHLSRLAGVDAEVGGHLHGAAHALRDVHKGAVGEDRRVQGRKVVVCWRHLEHQRISAGHQGSIKHQAPCKIPISWLEDEQQAGHFHRVSVSTIFRLQGVPRCQGTSAPALGGSPQPQKWSRR